MEPFRFDPAADASGTYLRGRIEIAPKRLVDVFGPPREMDGYKVSGMFTFADAAGNVFTVYDWKATTLFGGGVGEGEDAFPTPEEFWGNPYPETLQIGGRKGSVKAFKRWLLEKCDE